MNKRYSLIIFLILIGSNLSAQQFVELTLNEAIARARSRSVNAAVALNELRTAYWEYRSYRAELLPEMNFKATAPSYYNQYRTYMNDEGSYSFVSNNYLQMNGEISIDQNVWLTGGTLSLTTQLDFLRQLDGEKYNRYMSIPVAVTLNQPIFGVNTIKWNRKIEPVRYAEAKAKFLTATEEVAMTTISHYFNLLMAREKVEIAKQNFNNASKLYEVAKEKRAMGQISGNDLLQMELNLLNARSALTDSESNLKSDMFTLRSFLDYGEEVEIIPQTPAEIPDVEITFQDALTRALDNNKFAKNLRRRQLEADYQVAKAKGDMREISLFAKIGLTGTDKEFYGAYNNLRSNQVVEVGMRIPIVDWGRRRGKVKVAESNRQVVESRIRQETMEFNQDLFILVERFCNQKMQLEIAQSADRIARKRYDTNVETFLIGKISTLDLNDSQIKKDESRQEYVNQLFRYWYYFYQVRSITLWDYARNTGIDADIDRIVKN